MAPKPRRVSRELDCKLTDKEKLELGDQLASALTEYDDKQDEKQKITADQKPITKLIKQLQKKIKNGVEQRTASCEVIEGPGANIKIIRTDTREVVEERPMTPAEAQGDWLEQTEAAVERGKGKRGKAEPTVERDDDIDFGGGDELGDDDEDGGNVVPLTGRTGTRKAARKPGGKGKGRKR